MAPRTRIGRMSDGLESNQSRRDLSNTQTNIVSDNGIKKNVRGPTFMRKIWARDKQEAIQVEFNDLGQPIDEKSSSELAHFLGAIARNGRYAPLHYKNWIKVPQTYKKEMLTQVQEKFQLPPGQEDWILKSIAKKWRNWKSFVKTNYYDPNVSLVEQMKNVPKRVHEDQWKELVTFWNFDASKRVSDRNKVSRGHQKMVHRKGKMSFARVAEKKKKELGYYPSRSTLFIECYSKGETPGNEAASQAMEAMRELTINAPEGPRNDQNENDIYSQVMGKEKAGHVRMYGLGVCPSDLYGPIPSRATSHRLAMSYKNELEMMKEQYMNMNEQLQELRAMCMENRETPSNSHPTPSSNPSNLVSSLQSNMGFSSPTSTRQPIQVQNRVCLKSINDPTQIVAKEIVRSIDPSTEVGGSRLRPNWCEVHIQVAVEWDEELIRRYGMFETIGDALGAHVAWPLFLVERDESDD
ncbi:uncharacterized protein LOC127813348 [Diospyros lotus]|uniref:uncharacterized protein LOC127813348 n=1 Tax=Diospyros lotus TaxID=55363 RepID=UPI00224EFC00|nr:uncharacterized protein LOC127813348 [Diospyros lotus]